MAATIKMSSIEKLIISDFQRYYYIVNNSL
jgi:hypothetical protein